MPSACVESGVVCVQNAVTRDESLGDAMCFCVLEETVTMGDC
jgi:hypothetical protein